MNKSFIKFFTFITFIGISIQISADNNNPIPIEKLVCYGQGTSQSLSPSGEFYAAMVPVDKNVCDIEEESDQEASRVGRPKPEGAVPFRSWGRRKPILQSRLTLVPSRLRDWT